MVFHYIRFMFRIYIPDYVFSKVSNFLGYVISCIVAKHTMSTFGLHYIIVFELIYWICCSKLQEWLGINYVINLAAMLLPLKLSLHPSHGIEISNFHLHEVLGLGELETPHVFNERQISLLIGGKPVLESYDVFWCFGTFSVEIVQGMSKNICSDCGTGKDKGRENSKARTPPPPGKEKRNILQNSWADTD